MKVPWWLFLTLVLGCSSGPGLFVLSFFVIIVDFNVLSISAIQQSDPDIYIYIYIYTHTHTYIYIHTHIYIYTHTHTYIYIYTHIYIFFLSVILHHILSQAARYSSLCYTAGSHAQALSLFYFILFYFTFFSFLCPHLWHTEVPRPRVESELQLQAYMTATATWGPSCVCNLLHIS